MSAGADATRAPMLADALESMTHPSSSVPVIYARHLKEAAALLRRLAGAPCLRCHGTHRQPNGDGLGGTEPCEACDGYWQDRALRAEAALSTDSVTLVHAVRRALEDNTPGAMDSPPRAWSADAWSAIGEAINGHLRANAAALGRARPEGST